MCLQYTIGFQGVGQEADRPRGNLNYPAVRTHAKRTYSRLDDLRKIGFLGPLANIRDFRNPLPGAVEFSTNMINLVAVMPCVRLGPVVRLNLNSRER